MCSCAQLWSDCQDPNKHVHPAKTDSKTPCPGANQEDTALQALQYFLEVYDFAPHDIARLLTFLDIPLPHKTRCISSHYLATILVEEGYVRWRTSETVAVFPRDGLTALKITQGNTSLILNDINCKMHYQFNDSSFLNFFYWYIYWLCYYSCPISTPSLNSILPPLPPTFPPYSSCPWVILISSLASTFPPLFLPSPCLFSTYHLCYLFSIPFPPPSP